MPFVHNTSISTPWREVKDTVLTNSIQEIITHDVRTKDLPISIQVWGGVAQITGNVQKQEEKDLVRRILSYCDDIYAVWDILTLNGVMPEIADIGCGSQKQVEEAVGVDKITGAEVDVVTDLEKTLPFENNKFDVLFAVHVVEHIHNLIGLMNELHRILRPTGVLHIITPNWHFPTAVADPTHVRLMDKQTIKYFCQDKVGVHMWRPILVKTTEDSIFADLQPIKIQQEEDANELARWFY